MSALLSEVADILQQYGAMRCRLSVEPGVEITIQVRPSDQEDTRQSLDCVALHHEIEFLAGLAQVRAFATTYHIDSDALQKLLPQARPDDL